MNNDPFIKIENLNFAYGSGGEMSRPILKNINLTVEKGSFVAVLGHNGSGKSTLAKLLNMIESPVSGRITIAGMDITDPDMTEEMMIEIRRKIGMVFQDPDDQLVATIVEEDVAFGPENLGIEPKEIRRRVDEALKTVGMEQYATHAPHQLSGGQKQRIAIAGIIAMMPECIIFDESTAMLDPTGRKDVMDTILRLNKEHGITVMTITHNMEEAVYADRVIVINEGEIVLDGTPKEVFGSVEKLHSFGLDVPQVTELFYELNLNKCRLPSDVLTEKEGADVIARIVL